MTKIIRLIAGFSLLIVAGCAFTSRSTQPSARIDNNAGAASLSAYSGPKARIALGDFSVKAARASREIGSGLREMLLTALVNSSRFSVVERQELSAVMQEQELSVSAAAPQGSGPQKGSVKTADLVIAAAVTEFEPQSSGGRAGVGGGGGIGSGMLGGLLDAALNKAHIAMDIRIIDASTTEVIAAQRVEGEATDVAGNIWAGFMGSIGLGGGLAVYANTPMEKAIRICIIEAVRYIAATVPQSYFKY